MVINSPVSLEVLICDKWALVAVHISNSRAEAAATLRKYADGAKEMGVIWSVHMVEAWKCGYQGIV